MQGVLEQNRIAESIINRTKGAFGNKIGLFGKLFGCWHNNISRPFVRGNVGYRSCLHCGARKQFNPETLETHGTFYFPPVEKEDRI